jgi:hypothetical protein
MAHKAGITLALLMDMWPRALLIVFIVLQAADGLLTYAAVERFGAGAEGNPILATWIMLTGSGTALIGAKTMACMCGALLYAAGVHHVLAGLSVLYLFGAVVPWLRVFAQFT